MSHTSKAGQVMGSFVCLIFETNCKENCAWTRALTRDLPSELISSEIMAFPNESTNSSTFISYHLKNCQRKLDWTLTRTRPRDLWITIPVLFRLSYPALRWWPSHTVNQSFPCLFDLYLTFNPGIPENPCSPFEPLSPGKPISPGIPSRPSVPFNP